LSKYSLIDSDSEGQKEQLSMAPRPTTITDEQILEAARAVFLERGISATTAEVAARAGVAEGSLFNRFKTKFDLFQAAMKLEAPAWKRTLGERAGQGDLRAQLTDLGTQILQFLRRVLPLVMMSWSNRTCLFEDFDPEQAGPLHSLAQVTEFFAAEMRAGRLRPSDPGVLAHAYLGGIHNYVFFEILREQAAARPGARKRAAKSAPLPAEEFVRRLVDLLLSAALSR